MIIIPLFGAKYHGGIRIIFRIANSLAEKGYGVTIICPRNTWNPIYNLNSNIDIKLITSKNIFLYSLYIIFYYYNNRKSKYILSHWLTGFLYALTPQVSKKNTLYFIQDSEEVFFKKNTIYGKLFRHLVYYGYKNSTENFIVTTDYGEKKLKVITKGKKNNISKIILGVDKNIFSLDSNVEKKDVILFFPRKGWFKDFNLLLSTFYILYKNNSIKNFEFWFISQEKELFKPVQQLDRVKCFSVDSDYKLREYYNLSKILIHTSKYEGICLPILESLSCGTFVVTTNSFGPMTYLNKYNSSVTSIRDPIIIANMVLSYLKSSTPTSTDISLSVINLSTDSFLSNFIIEVKKFLDKK